jgi:hypothetical protein
MKTKQLLSCVPSKLRMILFFAAVITAVAFASAASAETINTVYNCGDVVEIELTSGIWLFATTTNTTGQPVVTTTEKMVDRIYTMAMAAWLAKKNVTFYYPNSSSNMLTSIPCIAQVAKAWRINVLQVQ